MSERDTAQKTAELLKDPELDKIAREKESSIAEQLEHRSPEKNVDRAAEKETASHEALEKAHSAEKEKREAHQSQERSPAERRSKTATKAEKKQAFSRIMKETRKDMNPAEKTFSKVIHNPAVEKTSEVAGKTIARPNAILSGAVTAAIVSLVVYLLAKKYGYPLSGSETIITFAFGWVLGILFDFLRNMITGGRK